MYPNPQDVVHLPFRASLEQYEEQANDLVNACTSGAPGAIRGWAARWPAQADAIARFAQDMLAGSDCPLSGAQSVVARVHGFESWSTFSAHLEDLARAGSPASYFEAAAEAIIAGDAAALEKLLREHPQLARARSTREHRATLLHYVAANGVENYRQRTPANAVQIAEILLDAGAEVDAEADMYDGGCTTLGLAATSIHPELAGVQNPLMQTLIDRGAVIDKPRGAGRTHSFVNGCLANGRAAAAEYLASHGARVDLDGAAGIGRLDLVTGFFDPVSALKPPATDEQVRAGFVWACEFGRTAVVEFLLDRGVPPDARHDGITGLHWAALGGHTAIVSLLLDREARVNAVEERYNGTPLTWALYGWNDPPIGTDRDRYYDVIARLVRAGAEVNPDWIDDRADHTPFANRLRADARMRAALSGGGS